MGAQGVPNGAKRQPKRSQMDAKGVPRGANGSQNGLLARPRGTPGHPRYGLARPRDLNWSQHEVEVQQNWARWDLVWRWAPQFCKNETK